MHYRLACNILGIEDGHDERTVKRAYAEKTKEFHPEEHPEEAEKIQQAYSFLIKDIRKNKLRVPTQEKRPVEEKKPLEEYSEDEKNKILKEYDQFDGTLPSNKRMMELDLKHFILKKA